MIQLRRYETKDLDAMFRLDESCFEEPFRFTQADMRLFAESHKAHVVVAESEGTLIGFAILHIEGRVGYVVTLDVAEQFRRCGLARQLMQALERQAVNAQCAALGLHVFVGNTGAISFYERSGYARVGDVSGFYGKGLDAWVYQKTLTEAK